MIEINEKEVYHANDLLDNMFWGLIENRKLNLKLKAKKCNTPINLSLTELCKMIRANGLEYYFLSFKSYIINLYLLCQIFSTAKINGSIIKVYFNKMGVMISRDQSQKISVSLKKFRKTNTEIHFSIDEKYKITGSDI